MQRRTFLKTSLKTPFGVEESIRYDLDYLRPLSPRSLGPA